MSERQKVIFNCLEGEFKSIKGSIKANEEVKINILIEQSVALTGVNMVINKIDNGEIIILPLIKAEQKDGYNRYSGMLSMAQIGIYYYYFALLDAKKESQVGLNAQHKAQLYYNNAPKWQLSVYKREYEVPKWAEGKIMYHIFVDRFNNEGGNSAKEGAIYRLDWGNAPEYKPSEKGKILNNDFFGGNLRGIIAKLPYLKSLNVGIIYLSPIFEAYSNHKYDTGDYNKIDEMFGSEADYISLTSIAAKLGIKVILDGVFNHTGSNSRYFDKENKYKSDGAYQKQDSIYSDWYTFTEWNKKYLCWWNIDTLPTLNGNSLSLRNFLCEKDGIVRKWLKLGASGWRLDVVDEINDEMLNCIVNAAKTEKSDALIIGEVWEDASNKCAYGKHRSYFLGKQLDTVMNYLLKNAIIDFIRNGNAQHLSDVNFQIMNNYPKETIHLLMNILGTHDTARILTELNGDNKNGCSRETKSRYRMSFEQLQKGKQLLKLSAVLQYTLCGFPCIYYGDEAGVQGCNDPFNRTCFPWNSADVALTDFYRLLGEIRTRYDVFKEGEFIDLSANEDFYSFERINENQKIIVAVNRNSQGKIVEVEGDSVDLLTKYEYSGKVTVLPDTAVILYLKNN
ncbi:MAG: alpha-amylase family glycosyl hydrolase [Clostridia bacterium]